ncbi:hypothetical protein NC653_026884 [Populus alba x Populus x berolinensis]|uniref:Uncharacterized protein n=1 Tax=Populus alba x Populus x berolinensis TaxID=444605 RepID=A0AAD6M4B3_9ROSI|nr:hypothetical protein NC653_026884 [Populus alba x Populus x berolinensis]
MESDFGGFYGSVDGGWTLVVGVWFREEEWADFGGFYGGKVSEEEAQEKQQRADLALLEAKRMTSQYQKEAEKCDSGMDSCEAAREKAEKVVGEQRKHPAIWELRAREREWREGIIRSQVNQNFE